MELTEKGDVVGEHTVTPERGWDRLRHSLKGLTGPGLIYVFVTAVLVLLSWQAVARLLAEGHPGVAAAVVVAVVCLVVAFWANGLLGGRQRWWPGYVAVQSALVGVLVVTTQISTHIDIFLAPSALLCLAGEALGTWGNTKRGFALAGFYLAAAAGVILLATPRSSWVVPLNQFGILAATVIVLVVLSNRADAERLRAQTLAAELRASSEQVAALTRQAERQRMARELHDTLAQGLTGITLQLEAARGTSIVATTSARSPSSIRRWGAPGRRWPHRDRRSTTCAATPTTSPPRSAPARHDSPARRASAARWRSAARRRCPSRPGSICCGFSTRR